MSELIAKERLNTTETSLQKLEDRQNQTDKSLSQIYNTCNRTDQRLNQLQQEIVDVRNLRNEKQLQSLSSLQKEVQTLNLKSHQLESISQAISQDFLALYRKTQITENYVTNNTFFISQIQNNMNQSENIAKERYSTTENSLKKLENGQNHTNKYLCQFEHRHNMTYSELFSKIYKESEKGRFNINRCYLAKR
ncbi:unnamed protein product [Mytilus coruscus]|uniref:Uncharacterized protein n=1 Tax=Mytilus coruscus TaxID=42192 RepID=A0A6J8EEK3_MYTCO|nr:unnamed protein product [Mytilus coruscus]